MTDAYSLVEHFGGEHAGGLDAALSRPADGLRELGARLARQWSR